MAKLEKQLEQPRSSIAGDPNLEIALKILFPLAWIFNVALYVWANSLIGANVHIHVEFNSEPGNSTTAIVPILPSVFAFSLMGTVEDMWTAKVYPLSIIVFFMSGMWPQIKLFLMMWCWVAVPGKHISGTSVSLRNASFLVYSRYLYISASNGILKLLRATDLQVPSIGVLLQL